MACQKQEPDSSFAPLPSARTIDPQKQLMFINERIEDNSFTAEFYYRRAILNQEANRYRAGMRDIQAAIRLDSSKSEYHFLRAHILSELNTPRDAINSALTAEKMGYSGLELDLLLGKLHFLNQNYGQSLLHLRRARQVSHDNPEISYYFGAIYAQAEDTAQAFNELDNALLLDPKNIDAYVTGIQLANKFNRFRKSQQLAQQSLKNCAPTIDLSYEIAQTLLVTNQVDSAAYWFEKILKEEPESWKASLGMAKYLIAKKQYIEAEDYYVNALEYNPNIEGGYYQLGYIYEYYAKNYEKALKYYTKAKRLNRGNEEIMLAVERAERKKAYKNGYRPRPILQDTTNQKND
ncbi:MAG: tetratricopeptide repeat protein [Flammeovirgaceae bacterium]